MFKPLVEDSSGYIAYFLFAVYVVTALVRAFATKRPKNHYLRVRDREQRRALRAVPAARTRVSVRPNLGKILGA